MQAGLWLEARSAFEAALESGEDPAALEGMGNAVWWLGERERSHRISERAYVRYREEGDGRSAARVALWLAREYGGIFGPTTGQGWVARAETLLAESAECPEAGWLALARSAGEGPDEAEREAAFALEVARRCNDPDLEAVALGHVGLALVLSGRVSDGMARLDESMASVSAGEVRDFVAAGVAYCTMLGACERTLDFRRAEQWCRVTDDFSRRHHSVPLFAVCRTFYGDVLIATGRWTEAEEKLGSALEAYQEAIPAMSRLGLARLAKLRAKQGRFEEAAQLLDGFETDSQAIPTLALVQLARGEANLAVATLERALRESNLERLSRLPLLIVLVDARLAEGDLDGARQAAELVREVADVSELETVSALADLAEGKVARMSGNDARESLEAAVSKLGPAQMPLELAEARLELAQCLASSDPQMAVTDARGALKVFESLGAERHANAAAELLRSLGQKGRYGPKQRGELTKRETEVLRLLGEGLTNPEIAERLYITRKTVEHHVGHVLAKLDLRNRAEAVAYALNQGERLGQK